MINILFDNRQDIFEISKKHKEIIKKAVEAVLSKENLQGEYELSLSFVSNEEIKELNREYRNVDSETDVLSFPMNEDFGGLIILGDIVISTEKILEQARDYNHSLEREMIYLVVHSMLHLLGYDHMDSGDKENMRGKEKEIIKNLQIFK